MEYVHGEMHPYQGPQGGGGVHAIWYKAFIWICYML